jgi:hypothetical protein
VRAFFCALSGWRPTRAVLRRLCDLSEYSGAYVRQTSPAWLCDCAGEPWRRCPRLPLCLADSSFVVDNIRCQHSPPATSHLAIGVVSVVARIVSVPQRLPGASGFAWIERVR